MSSSLLEFWNHWEIQLMVLTSFVLQLFLFVTGSLRRRNINGALRLSIWLAYIGADLVAVYALGLFSQYEEKHSLGRKLFRDTSPFLWVPFLLLHLGGQDSITAVSLEDNNLWLRHLLNLGIQGTLALYVFWKSIPRMNSQVLFPAPFIFVSGLIKYGERTWALRTGSRDGLGKSSLKKREEQQPPQGQSHGNGGGPCISSRARASYALQTVHLAQGLLVGRTMLQLGGPAQAHFEKYFKTADEHVRPLVVEKKVKIIMMELDMMFDLLYTKAMVLQRKNGLKFRCAAQVSMVVAFMLFMLQDHHARKHSSSNSNRVDTAITYTLFVGAIIMEACSVATVIASPWTWAHLDDIGWLYSSSSSSKAFSPVMKAVVRCKKMRWLCQRPSSYSIGQHKYYKEFEISLASTPTKRIICKVISALGIGTQYCHWYLIKHVEGLEAQRIVKYVVGWFDSDIRSPVEEEYCFISKQRLNYQLCLPFEHALYRLRIYTDLHISRHFDDSRRVRRAADNATDVMEVKEDCEMLSNYMCYLASVYPSMVPVSRSVHGGSFVPGDYCSDRLSYLERAANSLLISGEPHSASPFEPQTEGRNYDESDLKRSLVEIRDMWMRILVYVAGKCSPELHARQLAKGGELLTFVWLLMLHHGLGDAATEMKLLTSDDPSIAEPGSVVVHEAGFGPRPEQPRYAFEFRRRQHQRQMGSEELQFARMMQQIMRQQMMMSGNETEVDDGPSEPGPGGAPEQN